MLTKTKMIDQDRAIYAAMHKRQSSASLAAMSEKHPVHWRRYVRWSIEHGERAWAMTPSQAARDLVNSD